MEEIHKQSQERKQNVFCTDKMNWIILLKNKSTRIVGKTLLMTDILLKFCIHPTNPILTKSEMLAILLAVLYTFSSCLARADTGLSVYGTVSL